MIFSGKQRIRIRVAALIFHESKILLLAHRKKNNVYWLPPGGGVGYGESLPEALKREIKEELGIDIEVGNVLIICDSIEPKLKRHILHVFFQCSHTSGEYHLGKEKRLHDFSFFSAEELRNITLFPPVKEELCAFMEGSDSRAVYLEKNWEPL